jgi:hypothetical protein
MTNFAELASAPCDPVVPVTDQLRLALTAYLARFQGSSRYHTESDLAVQVDGLLERPAQVQTAQPQPGGPHRPADRELVEDLPA